MIDAHVHLDRLKDVDGCLDRARRVGLTGFLLPSVGPDTWATKRAIADGNADVRIAYGIHPWAAASFSDTARLESLSSLRKQVDQHRPAALGEMGLDHHSAFSPQTHSSQEKCFVAQLAIAHLLNLPIVLHVVRAHGRCLDILRDMGVPEAGGMVHSFSGSPEVAKRYVDLGLHISFSANLTKSHHKKAHKAAVALPLNRILVETDSPDQLPMGRISEQNEPAFLVDVIEALAAIRGELPLDVAVQTEQNARKLFGF